jgi:hypothetical protein
VTALVIRCGAGEVAPKVDTHCTVSRWAGFPERFPALCISTFCGVYADLEEMEGDTKSVLRRR